MTDIILRDLSIGVITLGAALSAVIFTGASFYDIKEAKSRQLAKNLKPGRRGRPLVSVIIYSHNQSAETIACLNSLIKSRHRKLEIIVINNASTDDTKPLLKAFVHDHPKRAIRVINKRTAADVEVAVRSGLKASSGDIVLLATAQSRFEPRAISKAADELLANDEIAVIPASLIEDYPSALNLWLRFKGLLGLNWQKTASLLRTSGSGIHFGVFYTRQMVKKPKADQAYRFVSDIILKQQLAPSLSRPRLATHELAVAGPIGKKSALRPFVNAVKLVYRVAALPIFTWYALYLTMNRGYSNLLFMAWAIFSFIFVFAIWTSEYLAYPAKARFTALAPAVFSLAVIMVFVEAAVAVMSPLAAKISGLSTKARLAT